MKTIFAHFGLTYYQACVLEHHVINMLVMSRVAEAGAAAELLRTDPYKDHFKETLGRLVRRLTDGGVGDPALVADLVQAVKARNHLVHDFWRERAEDFCSSAGRRT